MIDLSDVTFMIPIQLESEDRIMNVNIITLYLRTHFNKNIIIAEQGYESLIPNILSKTLYNTYIHYKTQNFYFHKAKLINAMVKKSNTKFVAMHDSDILCHPNQYEAAVNMLRSNSVDFVYPFDGHVINVPKASVAQVLDSLQYNFVRQQVTNLKALAHGGCVMYNREKFINAGMMNENFIAYGPEDGEQDYRLRKLGYRHARTGGALYHLEHARTENSRDEHKYAKSNFAEFTKVRKMNVEGLKRYINTWEWINEKNINNNTNI